MWTNQREACRPGGTQAILRASMLQGKGCPHLGEVLVACVIMQPVIWYWAAWLRRRKLAELKEVKKLWMKWTKKACREVSPIDPVGSRAILRLSVCPLD
jgi:hypothetical protein